MKHLWLWVGLGGFLGSLCRWSVYLLTANTNSHFPYATFLVNLTGSFLIGLLAGWFLHRPALEWQAFLITGFCGGFTTFSAFSIDTLKLLQTGEAGTALVYASGSVLAGILAAYAGFLLINLLIPPYNR